MPLFVGSFATGSHLGDRSGTYRLQWDAKLGISVPLVVTAAEDRWIGEFLLPCCALPLLEP